MARAVMRASAHGVDVAEGVGGGDLAEGVGVVHDGGEEIYGLDERQVRVELIHSGVVGVVEADQDVRVVLPGEFSEDLVQRGRTQFGSSAPGFDGRGEAGLFGFGHEEHCRGRSALGWASSPL